MAFLHHVCVHWAHAGVYELIRAETCQLCYNKNMSHVRQLVENKSILVVGLGLQGGGLGLTKFLADQGARLTVTDIKSKEELRPSIDALSDYDITYSLGKHKVDDFLKADIIFKGPSVPWDLPELQAAQEKGIPIEMETSFFAKQCPGKIIGVTGTRGKSTTSHMIFTVLKELHASIYLAGNIPEVSTISLLQTITEKDIIVLELSSWQLSGFHRAQISPWIGVFTNFYPDHLSFYPLLDDYLYDKKAIYRYQKPTDYLIAHNSLKEIISKDNPQSNVDYYNSGDFPGDLRYLMGKHNRENAAAALMTVEKVGCPPDDAVPIIKNFKGLAYREELIKKVDGVSFINDSTSTTPTSTMKAIDAFQSKPIILILGGNNKKLPVDKLLSELSKVDFIILLKGTFTDEVLPQLRKLYPDKISRVYEDLTESVKEAYRKAKSLKREAVILFSPGATSFAMFKNEFHRGSEFNRVVRELV